MNRSISFQITLPAVVVGLLISGLCLVSAWHVHQLQQNLTEILAENVASMRAAQQMEISARQLRFHCLQYLIDPAPETLDAIAADQRRFEDLLERADAVAPAENRHRLRDIRVGYALYLAEFARVRGEVERGGLRVNFRALNENSAFRLVVDPCREYLRANEESTDQDVRDSNAISQRLRVTMLLLGIGGPLGGLVGGYGIARGLRRGLHRLSVHVRDMAQRLDQDVATVSLSPDGDLGQLDRQLQHVVRLVTDVTVRAQQQQREMFRAQQLAAVGQLAASVAHEIRNPLATIKLLVEVALRANNPRPLTAENLQVIYEETQRLEKTVQHFLDLARPPAHKRHPGDLGAVVTRAVNVVRTRARQQQVAVHVDCPAEPLDGDVDGGQLRTVLVNLLFNALDAMPLGGRLEVNLERAAAGARITVADTGPGISPAMAGRLFTPFATTKATGSGLGLSVSKRVVEDHGGTIVGANRPEGGACFTITLPPHLIESCHADALDDR